MASRRPLVRASGGNRQLPSGDTLDASVTGNAATATKLATARTISSTGDVTGSATFDGSANANMAMTLAASGVTAGTYAGITLDSKGRATAATSYGLGSKSLLSLTNADDMTLTPGWYFTQVGTSGTLPSTYGVIRVDSFAGGTNTNTWAFQTFFSTSTSKVYYRFSINLAAWSTWAEQVFAGSSPALAAATFSLPIRAATYTLSTLPSASSYSGYLIQVSNASRGWALCRSNGTSWIDLYTQAAVA